MQFPDLNAPLAEILWAVVGAAAARLYMPERLTDDLDVLVRAEDEAKVQIRLKSAGWTMQGNLTIGGTSWQTADGFPVDVLTGRAAWTSDALREAAGNRDAQNLPILPLPYLVLMKFQASRVQDIADISRMLGQASDDNLAQVRAVFTRWIPDELEDLESLIVLGKLEMQT